MSRPRKRGEDRIALFPFLSVLICTIGVLTLILVSSVIGQVDEATTSSASLDKKYQEIRQKLREEKKNSEGQAQRQQELNAAVFDYFRKIKDLKEKLEKYGEISTPEGILKYKNLTNQVGQLEKNIKVVKSEIVVLDEKLEKEDANGTIRAKKPKKGAKEIEGLRSDFIVKTSETEDLVDQIENKKQELMKIEEILAILNKQKKSLAGIDPATEEELDDLVKEIENTRMAWEEIQQDLKPLQMRVDELRAFLKGKPKPGETIGKLAGKADDGARPIYVDCGPFRATIISGPNKGERFNLLLDGDDRDEFKKFARRIKFGERIILLVRPKGIDTQRMAKKLCDDVYERPGIVPVLEGMKFAE